ncbi:hypothetical protein C8D77_111147 [Mesorhizobium loti]|uniref:Uncharacterized protein n=1 Tax=Rhizobium loti TaxID=381 RepID=A0A8E2WAI4_RHILI|nr:hypothetical protein [Mesorhizobium loti]PWJ88424.1 hypothetical protein C8D77_111147 [Mesorhizobium loti]
MTDQYAKWRQLLKLAGGDCRELTRDQLALVGVSVDSPESGFYRNRAFKGGELLPVAIWRDAAGATICLQGGKEADADKVWNYACRNPITEALYHSVLAGGAWPDEPPTVAKDHNQPSKTGDVHKDLTAELAAEKEMAEAFLKKPITTQEQADQSAIWSKRLAAIAKKATDLHRVEKQPSLDEGRKVDDKWRDLKEQPAELSKRLKRHMDAFLQEQDRIEQERQRKAREEADKIRREAEDAARKVAEAERAAIDAATAGGVAASFEAEAALEADRQAKQREAEKLAQQAADAERETQARNANAGRTGARVALRTFVSARVVDYEKALLALKDHPEMKTLVEQLANRAVKAGLEVAGVERMEEKRAA